jgi:uncharacterized LabA/DUF88 family protein
MKSLAILLDGGFVRKRLYRLLGRQHATADDIVRLSNSIVGNDEDLFRIYYYDCLPLEGADVNPFLNKRVNFGMSATAKRMKSLLDSLARRDHVAFRRGEISFAGWGLNPVLSRDLLRNVKSRLTTDRKGIEVNIRLDLSVLAEKSLLDLAHLPKSEAQVLSLAVGRIIRPEIRQKRVDIKIGLDVAWLASRRIVDRIALVTADTDFVPAMKFARREGVQVILVPLDQKPRPELVEHADEVRHKTIGPVNASAGA